MTGDTGYYSNSYGNRLVVAGTPLINIPRSVETVANVYPGRLLMGGTADNQVIVCDGVHKALGWCGYDNQNPTQKADNWTDIQTVYDTVPVLRGGNFVLRATMAVGFEAKEGDYVMPWSAGCVAPCIILPSGQLGVRIPFVFLAGGTVVDTGVNCIAQQIIGLPQVYVTTVDAGETIDIGFINAVEGGDEDGLIKLLSVATAGWATLDIANAAGSTNSVGAYLEEVELISDATTYYFPAYATPGHICDGTIKSICYTMSSSDTAAGYFFVPIGGNGSYPVGICEENKAASVGAAGVTQTLLVRSLI